MNRRRIAALGFIFVALAPLAVVSTPPSLPPVHAYRIGVYVFSSVGEPREDVPVAIAAKCGGQWRLLRRDSNYCVYVDPDKGTSVALTNSKGKASLMPYVSAPLESIAVAFVLSDTFLTGDRIPTKDQVASYPLEQEFYEEDEGYLCSDSVNLSYREIGTVHEFSSDTLIVGD